MSIRTARVDWLQGLGITIVSAIAFYANISVAQITPDGTLPNNSNVTLEGKTRVIEGGTTRGANLFHSFEEFSIPNGSNAFFNNPLNIQNILARVTGKSISNIDGLIRTNGTANLFLLNPNGIVFGQNARLNINGSFSATTAGSFKFSNGSEFSAINPQAPPLLTVNITPGLQYGASQPGATITNTGNLAPRQDLTLVADKLDLQGELEAGRNITLIGNQEITLKTDLTLNPINNDLLGKVSLTTTSGDVTTKAITTNGGAIEIQSGGGIITQTLDTRNGANNGGAIALTANGSIKTSDLRSYSYSASQDTRQGGEITLVAKGGNIATGNIYSTSDSRSGSAGNGGNIILSANNSIRTGDLFSFSSSGFGSAENGGDITFSATNGSIKTGNLDSSASSAIGSIGNGGDITFSTTNGSIKTGNLNSSVSSVKGSMGNGGAITLNVIKGDIDTGNLNSSSGYEYGPLGNAGAISLNTSNGSIITKSLSSYSRAAAGSGANGGAITLNASDEINIMGDLDSASYSDTFGAIAGANGGTITLSTSNNIKIKGKLDSSASSRRGGHGNGGAINLESKNGTISADELNSFSEYYYGTDELNSFSDVADGGTITLEAYNGINIIGHLNSSSFSNFSGTKGNGGAIALKTFVGNISTGELNSSSYSVSGKSANGGEIIVSTSNGSIFTKDLRTFSYSALGGAITLSASDTIKIGAVISTGVLGSGNITIDTQSPFTLDNFIIASDSFGSGDGGNIQINARSISFINGGQVSASSHSNGRGGNVTLSAFDFVEMGGATTKNPQGIIIPIFSPVSGSSPNLYLGGFIPRANYSSSKYGIPEIPPGTIFPSGVFTQATTNSTGNAGNLTIETGQLIVKDGGAIATTTFGQSSNAGNISIKADSILVDNGSILSGVAGGARGDSGTINLQTRSLDVTKEGIVQTQTLGQGKAGEITVNATEQVNISGAGSALRSSSGGENSLLGDTSSAEIGQGGNINLTTANLSVFDNAVLDATTATNSQGGNITVNANTFQTTTGGQLLTSTSGTGNAGDIAVNVEEMQLGADSGLFAQTRSTANAGNLTIQPLNDGQNLLVNLENGAQISAATLNSGKGGRLTVKAPESITIRGNGSIISAETTGKGTGGDLTLETGNLTVTDQAQVTVSSVGSGKAGGLTVDADSILLDNQGKIRADTTGGGGDIFLSSPLLLLRRGSSITTNASGNDIPGGNITIDAKNGFIVAVPNENSDIRADSANFRGGDVTIKNIAGIFGIQSRNEPSPNTSDITAKGATPDLRGNVQINAPDVDPSNGLAQLPTNLVDASSQISNACTPGTRQFQNTFVATGRGGLPMSPTEPLQDSSTVSAWVRLRPQPDNSANTTTQLQLTAVSTTPIAAATPIVEASGWVINSNGNIELVAQVPQLNPHSSWHTPASCPVPQ